MHFDWTVNVPTIASGIFAVYHLYRYLSKAIHKLDTMWVQFLIEHPEYERREIVRLKI